MESIDHEMARRVWDRVNGCGQTGPDPDALTALLSQELTDAAVLFRLSKRLGGRGGELLGLARQGRQHAGYLRGICAMINRNLPSIAVPIPGDEPVPVVLRKCYVNSLRRMGQYESLSADSDYGPVFRKMAAAEQEQCASLLALIGKTGR